MVWYNNCPEELNTNFKSTPAGTCFIYTDETDEVPLNWYLPRESTVNKFSGPLRQPLGWNRGSYYGGYIQGELYWKAVIQSEEDPMEFVGVPDSPPDYVLLVNIPVYKTGDVKAKKDSYVILKLPGLADENDKPLLNSTSKLELDHIGTTDPALDEDGETYVSYALLKTNEAVNKETVTYWYSSANSCAGALTQPNCQHGLIHIKVGIRPKWHYYLGISLIVIAVVAVVTLTGGH